jgi:ABC-2 type transport system permease protein
MTGQIAQPAAGRQLPGTRKRAVVPMSGLVNGVIVRITLRATLSRKRAILFALPAVVLIGISALLTAAAGTSTSWPPEILGTVGFTVLLPLTALIIGTSVLGAEIEDGSIVHLLATPVPRAAVIISKYLVAVALTIAFAAIPEYLASAVATSPGSKLSIGLLVGAVAASLAYNALFIFFSATFRPGRALAFGLIYVVLWEGLLSNLVPGVALLSMGHYGLAIANSIADNSALHAYLSTGTAIGMGLVTALACLWLAVNRLSAFAIKGDIA